MATSSVIHLSEFVDALAALRRGHVMVVMDHEALTCVLDGSRILWSFHTLDVYGLITEFVNPQGFEGLRYYRMTDIGRQFADRALALWDAHPWHERLMLRLLG